TGSDCHPVLNDRSENAKPGDHNPPLHRPPAVFQNMVPPLLWGLRDGFIPCIPNENTPVGGCRQSLRHSIFKILNWIVPSGAGTLTVSPSCLPIDRKSTRLNSSHVKSSYAVFC